MIQVFNINMLYVEQPTFCKLHWLPVFLVLTAGSRILSNIHILSSSIVQLSLIYAIFIILRGVSAKHVGERVVFCDKSLQIPGQETAL